MTLALFLAVAGGGLVGAPARYLLDRFVDNRIDSEFPWGTFIINVSGSMLLGFVAGLMLHHHIEKVPYALIGTGFCGAFTTFSTFTFETLRLAEEGALPRAAFNVFAGVAVGLLAATAGIAIGLVT